MQVLHTVHITLGPGFLHQVYRRATRIELSHIGLNAEYLKELPLRFDGHYIGKKETRLFWVEQKLLLATVALAEVMPAHISKLRWAMREVGCQLGLLANFYPTQVKVQFVRIA
jgi:GxxExxY protein